MKRKFEFGSVVLGAALALALGCFMGSSKSPDNPEPRYDATYGLGGLQIVDHSTNTLYLYGDGGDKKTLKLGGSIDLSNAGKKAIPIVVIADEK